MSKTNIINIKNIDQIFTEVSNKGFIVYDNCFDENLLSEMQNYWLNFLTR